MTELPSGPWRKVSVDFAGPFLNKDMALVFWDQYVWYPVVLRIYHIDLSGQFYSAFHTRV